MTPWHARLAVRLLPSPTRDRYGQELVALLEHSSRPLADALDVTLLAIRAHLEARMHHPLKSAARVALAVSLILFGYTVNDLSTGLTELPQHWWSTAAAAAVIASGIATFLTCHPRTPRNPAIG